MKPKTIAASAVILFLGALTYAMTADAQQAQGQIAGANSSSQSGSASQSGAQAVSGGSSSGAAAYGGHAGGGSAHNNGNTQQILFASEAVDLGDSVPATVAPALVSTLNGTCYGSTSGSIAVAGFGGSLGKTYEDEQCQLRLNSNMMNALGHPAVAYEVMCQAPSVLAADAKMDSPQCAENVAAAADGGDAGGSSTGDVLATGTVGLAHVDYHAQYFEPVEVQTWGLRDYDNRSKK